MSATLFATVIAATAVGAAVGLAYFAALGVNVRLYLDGRARWRPLALHAVRIAAAAAAFWGLATQGVAPVLAGLAGFLIAGTVARRWLAGRS